MISILQEESNNLKARMIQLTEENNKFKKDNNMLKQCAGQEFRQQIERQKEEILTLKAKI